MFHHVTFRSALSFRAVLAASACLSAVTLLVALTFGPVPVAGASTPSDDPAVQHPATEPTGPTGAQPVPPSGEEGGTGLRERRGTVRLRIDRHRATFGRQVRLRGRNGLGASGRVRIQLRKAGGRGWRTVRRLKADRKGRFHGRLAARTSGRLRALDQTGAASKPVRLRVRSRAKLHRMSRTVKVGRKLRITGTVRPRGRRTVKLKLAGTGRTVKVRSGAGGRFSYAWRPSRAGDVRVKARAMPDRRAAGDGSGSRKVSVLRPGGASFYGPGLYGGGVACGGTLRPGTRGVAHKSLPCGTKVTIQYGRRVVTTRVIDRGPYVAGRDWDLTAAVRNELGFGGVGTVWTNK